MKRLFFLQLMMLSVFINSAIAAEVFLDPGESIPIGDTQVYCRSSNSEPIVVVSSVDLACIKTLYDDHSGFPNWGDVIMWAYQDCRTAPLNQDGCITVSSANNQICYEDLTHDHGGSSGFPTNDELNAIQNACKDVVYNCGFYVNTLPLY